MDILTTISAIILILCGIFALIASYGILKTKDDMDNIVFGRIQILGIVDIISVVALICLGQPLYAILYFILAPFAAHAIANGHFYGEN
ncbi:MAG: cation:proton antiporter [Methanobacteriaceae archaeon]|nr:cation:proton antiporter [Methanobacteriaceae archaeon]